MKKFILSLFFVIFALFNICGEDLLHPVIRDDIDEDVRKIEQALVDYVLYPEMVERGFDVHQLDNMKIDGEMFEYIESFFRPNIEKGWLPLDNHHGLSIKDENGKWFNSQMYHKYVKFSNEYGTKDELLKKGYVENETMFYYPSNGEKNWRIGEWSWFNWKGWAGPSSFSRCKYSLDFYGEKVVYGKKDITSPCIETVETKKSFIITLTGMGDYINNVNLSKKDNLIIDLSYNLGGNEDQGNIFIQKVLKSKYKKIIIIINDTTSAGDMMAEKFKLSKDKRVILIGKNTTGCVATFGSKVFTNINNQQFHFGSMNQSKAILSDNSVYSTSIKEGIGIIPDIWAETELDVFINLWNLTEDDELKIDLGQLGTADNLNYTNYKILY